MSTSTRCRCEARIVQRCRLGEDLWEVAFQAPAVARAAQPGQFLHIRCFQDFSLRRPFSIYWVNGEKVAILFEVRGRGTRALAARQEGEFVDLLGPLGTPYSPVPARESCLLVAGGIGYPPLCFQAESAVQRGARVRVLYGARTASRLAGLERAVKLGIPVETATDDGSAGQHGQVTDLLRKQLLEQNVSRIYACGPNRMLAAVADAARVHGIEAELALESRMGCGLGVCLACVIPARTSSGEMDYLRVCTEGPVFAAEVPVFEEIGW